MEHDKFHIICCNCKYRYSLTEGVLSYEANKTPRQEEVKLWLEKRDISALIMRCPKCGLLHLLVIFLFDQFFEKVFKNKEAEEKKEAEKDEDL